jgi:purine-binding chemotaxis protein CheW
MEDFQEDKQGLAVVVFSLGNEQFGIDVKDVREVLEYRDVSALPKTPNFIEGVINLRGHIIGIVDLRQYFGFETSVSRKDTRIIIVRIKDTIVGLIVDNVFDVINLAGDVVQQTPDIVSSRIDNNLISRVARKDGKMIFILNLQSVLSEKEIMHLVKVRGR